METAENQNSVPEVILPTAEVQQEVTQPVPEQTETQPQEDADWIKNLRRDRKEALRRADEAEKRDRMKDELIQKLMAQQSSSPSNVTQAQEDILQELAKQEYVAGEQVAKGLQQIKQEFRRELEDVKKSYAAQHQNSLINELRREFPDFDAVVNPETLAILDETNPRLASAIAKSNDPYLMAVQSYEYIKAKGLSPKPEATRRAKETEMKIEQNKKTVQTPQAFEKRPMAAAFQMTDAMKQELQKEMYQYANQAGMGY